MDESQIVVEKTEQFATFRQFIRPKTQDSVAGILTALLEVYRANRITGPITINCNMGGVREMTYDQVAKIPTGSAADKAVEEIFARQSLSQR